VQHQVRPLAPITSSIRAASAHVADDGEARQRAMRFQDLAVDRVKRVFAASRRTRCAGRAPPPGGELGTDSAAGAVTSTRRPPTRRCMLRGRARLGPTQQILDRSPARSARDRRRGVSLIGETRQAGQRDRSRSAASRRRRQGRAVGARVVMIRPLGRWPRPSSLSTTAGSSSISRTGTPPPRGRDGRRLRDEAYHLVGALGIARHLRMKPCALSFR